MRESLHTDWHYQQAEHWLAEMILFERLKIEDIPQEISNLLIL